MVPHGRGGLLGITGFDRVDDVRVPFDIHVSQRGAIFTATPRRGGRTALQVILGELDYQRIVGYSQNRLAVAGARSGAVINEDAR